MIQYNTKQLKFCSRAYYKNLFIENKAVNLDANDHYIDEEIRNEITTITDNCSEKQTNKDCNQQSLHLKSKISSMKKINT